MDRSVALQLRSLPEGLALRVARHLVAAGRLLDTDPKAAYDHAAAARRLAGRVSAVREAAGETAYAAGMFKEALTELKAARRMTGATWCLPMIADCERALGRPERALDIARDPAVAGLDQAERVEMLIVEAGARRDLGDPGSAVRVLQSGHLHAQSREPWLARLRYAYADALLASGDRTGAREWFERAAGVDATGATDAEERLVEFED